MLAVTGKTGRRADELPDALEEYRAARQRLLEVLGPRQSNRDPPAEFAEHFVAALTNGCAAVSPVQAGWDVQLADGGKMQVKYLANSVPGQVAGLTSTSCARSREWTGTRW